MFKIRILLSLLLLSMPLTGYACRCAPLNLSDYFDSADRVFQAEVLGLDLIEDSQLLSVQASVSIIETFKGKNTATQKSIDTFYTSGSSASCGLSLLVGQRYWFFPRHEISDDSLWVGSCDGSREVAQDFQDFTAGQVVGELMRLSEQAALEDRELENQNQLSCSEPFRYFYGPVSAALRQKISIEKLEKISPLQNPVLSPNFAYGFVADNPESFQRPPRVAIIKIDNESENILQIRLHGISAPVEPLWVNEKLLLLQTDWSPQIATEMLFDVELESIIYLEQRYFGRSPYPDNAELCQ